MNETKPSSTPMHSSFEEYEMWAEVESLPSLIRQEFRTIDEKVRYLLDHQESLSIKEIYVIGCGDSHCAGIASEMSFAELAQIPARSLPSMLFSRYTVSSLRNKPQYNPLVIGVSVSGEVARTVEGIELARQRGAFTVALTGDGSSRAAQAAGRTLMLSAESYGRSPGVRTYAISLLSLYLLAIRLGEVAANYTQDEAIALRNELLQTADLIERTIAESGDVALRIAQELSDASNYAIVGSGPNYATALFGAAKIIEAAGKHAVGQDIEEWAHLQYFCTEPDTPTMLIVPPGRSHDRAVEIAKIMRRLGRCVIANVAGDEEQIASQADYVLRVPGKVRELFSPLVYCVGNELLAAAVARAAGEPYFRQGYPAYEAGNEIRSSQIWDSFDRN